MAFQIGSVVATITANIDGFKDGLNKASREMDSFKDRVEKGGNLVTGALKTIVFSGIAVGAAFTAFGITAGLATAKIDELTFALHAVAKANNVSATSADKAVDALRSSNIAYKEALSGTLKLISAGIDLDANSQKLATAAKDLGIGYMGSSEAFNLLTDAIVTNNTQQLGNLGIVTTQTMAFEQYAKTIGKSASELNAQERQLAIMSVVFAEGEKRVGAYDAAMGSASKQWASFTTRILPDFIVQLGKVFEPAVAAGVDALTAKVKEMGVWVTENKDKVKEWGENLKGVTEEIIRLTGKVIEAVGWLIQHKDVVIAIAGAITVLLLPALVKLAVEGFINNTLAIIAFIAQGWQAVAVFTAKAIAIGITTAAFILETAVTIASTVATGALTIATWLLNAALAVLTAPITLVILAIVALIAIGVLLWKNWDLVKAKAGELWKFLTDGFWSFVGVLKDVGEKILAAIKAPFEQAWNFVQDIMNKIKNALRNALDPNVKHSPSLVDRVKKGVDDINDALGGLTFTGNMSANAAGAAVSYGGNQASTVIVKVDMAGAIITDAFGAGQMGELMGDAIIKRLQQQVRI